jgi:diguanylate cyclase (GGDEF)-like protein
VCERASVTSRAQDFSGEATVHIAAQPRQEKETQLGLMPSSSARGTWARIGLAVAAILLVLAGGLFALGTAREDALMHERYARALDMAMQSLDAQQAATRVNQSLLRVAQRGEAVQKLIDSLRALAEELASLRRHEPEALSTKELARAEKATARLLALARDWQRPAAGTDPARSRQLAAAQGEFEAIDRALDDLLAARRNRIDEAARREHRADRIARVSAFAAGALALVLGLVLTLVAWRSLSTNARLMTQLTQMAREDGLTGVANRRTLDERLPQEMARATRGRYALTVVMMDLDHFKRFNDRRGHAAGDALLRNAAQAWLRQLRPTDLLARYGGEEFTLVLPICDEEQAEHMVERLQPLMPERQTFSAGVATWNGNQSPQELLAAADRALLQAKRGGRNRIVIAGREPQISLPLKMAT